MEERKERVREGEGRKGERRGGKEGREGVKEREGRKRVREGSVE